MVTITVAVNLVLAGAIQFIPIAVMAVAAFWNAPLEIKKSTVTAPYSDALEKAFAAVKLSRELKSNTISK